MNSSSYVYGSHLSYLDYLQGRNYVEDLKGSNRSLVMDISRQNRELIASNAALAQQQITARAWDAQLQRDYQDDMRDREIALKEDITASLENGFERLTYSISDLADRTSAGLSDLGAKFQWCCSRIISEIGAMNDTLKELVKIAKTPTQTAALEHFEIARDAHRQGLYAEAVEELNFAINGVPGVSAGYKLEWRLHQMMGVIKLGFLDCDLSLVNHPTAEQSFLSAARYAAKDFPTDAAGAWLSAGWAAYCQGKMQDAISYTNSAVQGDPKLGEGWYQLAKIHMALDEPDTALAHLKSALYQDVGFALKAASDGDFLKHEAQLQKFLKGFTENYYRATAAKMVEHIQANPEYNQIVGVVDVVNEIMEPRTLMDYPQAFEDWYEFLAEIKEHCRFRKLITEEIAKAHKQINDLREILHSPELKRMNIVERTGDLLSQLSAIEILHSCNSIEKTKQCEFPVDRLILAIKKCVKDVYAQVDNFYDNEIRNYKKEIQNLDNEITDKTKEYEKSYEALKH